MPDFSDCFETRSVGGLTGTEMGLNFAFEAKTDIGLVRSNNEDNFVALPEVGLFAVCDGLGGHAAGEVASQIAVDTLRRYMASGETDAETRLTEALSEANEKIISDQQNHPERIGMGTTLSAVWLRSIGEEGGWIAHIGDSRVYAFRDDTLEQITEDHSPLFRLYKEGSLGKEELRHHPQKNLIERSLGLSSVLNCDLFRTEVRAGDRFLLCTDGLSDMVSDAEISRLFREVPFEKLCDRLVESALERGGYDNISAIVIRVKSEA